MSKERRRSIKTAQVGLRALNFIIDGVTATPVASGFDVFQIASVIDSGNGLYTIIFTNPFERVCQLAGFGILTADRTLVVTAVAFDRITVQCTTLADVDTDSVFSLCVVGSDSRFDY